MSSSQPGLEAKGFFASLIDFRFTSFVTLKFLKLIYTILVALIMLVGLFFLITGLSRGGSEAVLWLVLVPMVTLLYLIFARIYMEIIALFFRIGENTTMIARSLSGGGAAGGQLPAPYGFGSGPLSGPAAPYGYEPGTSPTTPL